MNGTKIGINRPEQSRRFSHARKEVNRVESATRLEITFKSGDTITYREGEWDDYGYDGKAISVKLKGAWVGIYNFDHVFSVELKP